MLSDAILRYYNFFILLALMYMRKFYIYFIYLTKILFIIFLIQNIDNVYGENFYISPSLGENFSYANNKIKINIQGENFSESATSIFEEIILGYNRNSVSSLSLSLSHNSFKVKIPKDYEEYTIDNKLDYILTIFGLNYKKYLYPKIFLIFTGGGGISYFVDSVDHSKAFVAQTSISINYNLNYEIDFFSKAIIDTIFSNLSQDPNTPEGHYENNNESTYIFQNQPIILNFKLAIGFSIKI